MRRGFTILEILLVILLLVFGLLTILTVYSSSLRHGTQSRARILASVLCESLLAEVREHPYGTPAPERWGDPAAGKPFLVEVPTVVQGRYVATNFEVMVRQGPKGNGSFFDPKVQQGKDQVLVTVRWVEGTDASGARAEKEMHYDLVVKREPDLVER